MPTISESKKGGIKIGICYANHNPPHFHVFKGGRKVASVEICMVKPATGRKVDCYFTTGHVRRFDMAPLLRPDCGHVFRPLRDRKTFLAAMTVMNGTLAFDVAGRRDERTCVDIDADTIFEDGTPVGGTMRTVRCARPTRATKPKRETAERQPARA